MDNKEAYSFEQEKMEWRQFCETEPSITIYQQPWYWDAVCDDPDDWRVILIKKEGIIEAAFPFVYRRHHFIWYIQTPWQVPASGIWMRKHRKEFHSIEADFAYLKEIVDAVVNRLPYFDSFRIGFNSRLWSWQPFYWQGFEASPHYTMIISENQSIEDFRGILAKSRIKRVKKAEVAYRIEVNKISADEYWDFAERSFKMRGRNINYSKEKFLNYLKVLQEHNALQIRICSLDGLVISENIVLIDNERFYHQFRAQINDKNKLAASLIVYDSICTAIRDGKKFDFEGSMILGVAQFNLSFNPEYETLYYISKETTRFKVYNFLWKTKDYLCKQLFGWKREK